MRSPFKKKIKGKCSMKQEPVGFAIFGYSLASNANHVKRKAGEFAIFGYSLVSNENQVETKEPIFELKRDYMVTAKYVVLAVASFFIGLYFHGSLGPFVDTLKRTVSNFYQNLQ